MKRLATILALSLFFLSLLHAAPVDRETAATAAAAWMMQSGRTEYGSVSASEVFPFTREGITTHYIVNLIPDGFAIVAGDDIAVPVWMYGSRGHYDGSTLPPALAGMLDAITRDLLAAVERGEDQNAETADMWSVLVGETPPDAFFGGGMGIMAVSPMLSTTWNQTYPYNKDCPSTSTGGSGGHVYTGCVATAMAQVMRYHGFPSTGVGSHSYTHPTYGTLSANFGNTTYTWSSMPASISTSSPTAQKNAVAELIYHCGVSVEMDYGPTGSASSIYYAYQALKTFFRYKTTSSYISRSNYANSVWLGLLRGELDAGRPVLYRGSEQNGSGGHAFVIDGYTGTDYFHINMGWGGYLDGYYYLNSITPSSYNFNYLQRMVIGIEPDQSPPPVLVSPATQSADVCTAPTFVWSAASGATSYRLQIATDAAFGTVVHDDANLNGTSVQVAGLNRGTTYFWRMNATGSAGTSAWTTPWSFTTLQAAVTASGPTSFCAGGDVTLSTGSVTGATYQWLRDNTPLPGATQPWLTASQSGSYTVDVTLAGCATRSAAVPVTAHPLPTATILPPQATEICEGGSSLLVAQQAPSYAYQWLKDGQNIPGATTPILSASESGLYALTVSANGCTATSDTLRVVVHPIDPTDLTWTGSVNTDWNTPGNWDNPCAVPSTGDNVTIPSNCTPPASIPPCVLKNLTIHNSAGTTLSGNVTITGVLALQDGHLALGNHDLTISASGEISGGSDGSHIVALGAGQLSQLGIGTNGRYRSVTYPVGHGAGAYAPINLQNTGSKNDFGVRLFDEVRDGGLVGSAITDGTVQNTWVISAGSGGTDLALTFFWPAGLEAASFDRKNCFVSKNESGQSWNAFGSPAAALGTGPYSLAVSGVKTISTIGVPFSVGSGTQLYPVELVSFSATAQSEGVLLGWLTRNEVNNYGFEVLHQAEGSAWQRIGFLPSAETGGDLHRYRFLDAARSAGIHSYRLRQIDMDGSSELSHVLTVQVGATADGFTCALYPNPVTAGTQTMLQLDAGSASNARVVLYDALGRAVHRVFDGAIAAGSSRVLSVSTGRLPAGMYFLRIDASGISRTLRLQIMP